MITCISTFILGIPLKTAAQETELLAGTTEVSVSIGWNIGAYKESTYAPIIQKISDPEFHAGVLFRHKNLIHRINLDYMLAKPSSVLNETAALYLDFDPVSGKSYYTPVLLPCTAHRASIEYGLLFAASSNENSIFYAGPSFRTDAYIQFSNYPSVTGIFSLGPSVYHTLRVSSRDSFEFQGSLPLIGWAVRPSYAGADALLMKYAEESPLQILTLGTLVSLHNYQAVFGSVEYKHIVTNAIVLKYGSDFEYSRMDAPEGRPRYDLAVTLHSGILFTF